jgi:hypothetical protein
MHEAEGELRRIQFFRELGCIGIAMGLPGLGSAVKVVA